MDGSTGGRFRGGEDVLADERRALKRGREDARERVDVLESRESGTWNLCGVSKRVSSE